MTTKQKSVIRLVLEEMGIEPDVRTVEGRRIIQRSIYLAQAAGVPLGYSFGWYETERDRKLRTFARKKRRSDVTNDERMCPCGCGMTWRAAVKELMNGVAALNQEQAESILEETARVDAVIRAREESDD